MTDRTVRTLGVAALAGLTLLPTLISRMTAPANWGAHGLTTGFGRGRLDVPGIVSDGAGGSIDLPNEPCILTLRLSGAGLIHLRGTGLDQTMVASEAPAVVRVALPSGGRVAVESSSRIRLHSLVLERARGFGWETGLLAVLGGVSIFLARRGPRPALGGALLLLMVSWGVTAGSLSGTFARIALVQLVPGLVVAALFVPLVMAVREARFIPFRAISPLAGVAFLSTLGLTSLQLLWFDQPIPLGDPGAYLEMGGRFAKGIRELGNPLNLGPVLRDLQPYLALPATGLLYGVLRFFVQGPGLIYAVQALAIAVGVAALVSICETEIGPRAARIALAISLLHPSFMVLPGLVQPEPFILAAWTLAGLVALRASSGQNTARGVLGAGILLGLGLSLHPQGLSFILLALVLCLLPWTRSLARRKHLVVALVLGTFSVLLPVAAAEHFAKPLAHVLDRQYGFFAYTSAHPLGFWLYTDSDGCQGPLRIEDTTYQKELIAAKGDSAVASTFADVAAFASRHPLESVQSVLRNLHRLWHQPDNPFAVPFVLPAKIQASFHRGLVVLFVLSLPALLGGRLAILALPFVMLSMTYPAYHIFNKYATPALPFTIIGASLVLDRILGDPSRTRGVLLGLGSAALGALLPAVTFARIGVSGDLFMALVRGLLWVGLAVAMANAIRIWAVAPRARLLSGVIGFVALLASSFAASRTDTVRGTWAVSLERPIEVSCRLPKALPPGGEGDLLWLLVDAEAPDGKAPRIELNGSALDPPVPTMPTYGLASVRGHRKPATFRQLWRVLVPSDLPAKEAWDIRVDGGAQTRFFGDIRAGDLGPRLSAGNWPYVSVYRLMHEAQYRLPIPEAPAQACQASGLSGRPGIALVRIPIDDETQLGLRTARPLTWIF